MPNTDTTEKGLETLIVESLVNEAGYVQGTNDDSARVHIVDLTRLPCLWAGWTASLCFKYEQSGQDRAEYGNQVLELLSKALRNSI